MKARIAQKKEAIAAAKKRIADKAEIINEVTLQIGLDESRICAR